MLQGLYVLTDDSRYPHCEWPQRVEDIIRGGASVIQLRDKHLSHDELLPHAQVIRDICRHYGVLFIVNDRVTLARSIQADGVHLGQHDRALQDVRRYLGNHYLIGVSCYRNLYRARQAESRGADYAAFGCLFPSTTKTHAAHCPLGVISKAKRTLSIPVCGIGGIQQSNAARVLSAGADLLATSHAVFNADDARLSANKLHQQVIMSR